MVGGNTLYRAVARMSHVSISQWCRAKEKAVPDLRGVQGSSDQGDTSHLGNRS